MRVLLIANFEPDAQQSMSAYAKWVNSMVVHLGHEVEVIQPKPFFALMSRDSFLSKYLGYLDKFIIFPTRLASVVREFDLIHVLDHSNSMYVRMVGRKPTLVTCHDLLAIRSARGEIPGVSVSWTGRLLQRWIVSGLRAANHIVCVSQKTATDVRKITGRPHSMMRVIYNGLSWTYKPGFSLSCELAARLRLPPGRPYLLHVGGNPWYKNRLGVLRIFAHFATIPENEEYFLLMVGPPLTKEMTSFVQANGLADRILVAEHISNSELRELYCSAAALLFPSLEEGFGWPILEAQACGCLVITSGYPPMTEVAGCAAVFIDPAEPEEAARRASIEIRRADVMRAAGIRNLTRFAEAQIAIQYNECYEEVVARYSSLLLGRRK